MGDDKLYEKILFDAFEAENINDILKEAGYDLDEIEQEGELFYKRIKLKIKAEENKKKFENVLKISEQQLLEFKQFIEKESSKAFEKIFQHHSPQMLYRNLKELNDEEIKEILKDQFLLKLMEEHKSKNKPDDK